MQSTQDDLEASHENINIFRNLKNSNTSDVNIAYGSDSSGNIDFTERKTQFHKIKRKNFNKHETTPKSLELQRLLEVFEDSSSFEPTFIYYPNAPYKIIENRFEFDSFIGGLTPFKLDLEFSKDVESLIIRDSIFRKFISEIEKSLNIFIEFENIEFENRIFFEEDWEISDYEKLILSLKFKGIPFKEEMMLWKKINKIVYEKIKSMIHYGSEDYASRIKEWKKKFFIKLEM